uniref:Uncharacterized protein n=1 Tax=Kalanchoe fedtschenkoi TaxID=63787 RepID=A0A7N0V8C6_KALFE
MKRGNEGAASGHPPSSLRSLWSPLSYPCVGRDHFKMERSTTPPTNALQIRAPQPRREWSLRNPKSSSTSGRFQLDPLESKRKKLKCSGSAQSIPSKKRLLRGHTKSLPSMLWSFNRGGSLNKKNVNKDELLQMVRFGAEMIFSSKDSTITDEDIDRIIAKGEEATAVLDAKMKKFTEDAIKFKMDETAELYDFDDDKDENKVDFKKFVSEN